MTRTFTYLLPTNRQQTEQLLVWLTLCRRFYDSALEQQIAPRRLRRVSLSHIDQRPLTHYLAALEAMTLPPEATIGAYSSIARRVLEG